MEIFPTAWQRVIFRNFGKVQTKVVAEVIGTDEKTVAENAALLGLEKIAYDPTWVDKGFVTLIRENWDILENGEIAFLLGWTSGKLQATLTDYDFLDVKLGEKPAILPHAYAPLSATDLAKTKEIGDYVRKFADKRKVAPFDFYGDFVPQVCFPPQDAGESFTAPYSASYCDALLDARLSDYPAEYLARLAATGTRGVWICETLRDLSPFPFDPALSPDFGVRRKNLRTLTEQCAKFGIKVYIYLNEPRSLPEAFFEKHPDLRGQRAEDGTYSLCTSAPEVKKYLYDAVRGLSDAVPKLGGIMTITMSENPTHCYAKQSTPVTDCPRCRLRAAEEVAAEVPSIFARALTDAGHGTKCIANLWGWSDFMGWNEEMAMRGIDLLDPACEVLCVSEYGLDFERGGVKSRVIDYSISVVGPCDVTRRMLKKAKDKGHAIWAKVQINNSWECAGVPYLPTFDLMERHIDNLRAIGVCDLMLGWSLGGFPGGALPLINSDPAKREEWFTKTYEKDAETVKKASAIFSRAFEEYPFSIDGLYFGGQHMACGNLWSLAPDGRKSTMVCYATDDEKWAGPYGAEGYAAQLEKQTDGWKEGLALAPQDGNAATEEFFRYAEAAYLLFRSAYHLARFAILKKDVRKNGEAIRVLLRDEAAATERLHELVLSDARIGYEMTNHYFYTENRLLEKLVCLRTLDGIL